MKAEYASSEETVFTCRTHPKALVPYVAIFAVLAFVEYLLIRHLFPTDSNSFLMWAKISLHLFVVGLMTFFGIYPAIRWYTDTFELTTDRVIASMGFIYRDTQEISARRISQVTTERGLLDRIFGCGTIKLFDAANTMGLEFKDVPGIMAKKDAIDEARQLARRSDLND